MKKNENIFKGRIFPVTSEIGQGQLRFKAVVLESYGHLCLVKEEKSSIQGNFDEFRIYKVMLDQHGQEYLHPVMIDYSGDGEPPRYFAPDAEVRLRFDSLKTKMIISDSEKMITEDRKIRETKSKEEAEALKLANISWCKDRQAAITDQLRVKVSESRIEKLSKEKGTIALVTEFLILESLKKLIR